MSTQRSDSVNQTDCDLVRVAPLFITKFIQKNSSYKLLYFRYHFFFVIRILKMLVDTILSWLDSDSSSHAMSQLVFLFLTASIIDSLEKPWHLPLCRTWFEHRAGQGGTVCSTVACLSLLRRSHVAAVSWICIASPGYCCPICNVANLQ